MNYFKEKIEVDEIIYKKLKKLSDLFNCTEDQIIKQAVFHYLKMLYENKHFNFNISLSKKEMEYIKDLVKKENNIFYDPFSSFSKEIIMKSEKKFSIASSFYLKETEIISSLLERFRYTELTPQIQEFSRKLIKKLHNRKFYFNQKTFIQKLLRVFSLSSQEGLILMCLSESLLRIPDNFTQNLLIKDKIIKGNWGLYINSKESFFIKIASLCLLIIKKSFVLNKNNRLLIFFKNLSLKYSDPLIRNGIKTIIRFIGKQLIIGENIKKALENSQSLIRSGFNFSYDILGESAITEEDACNYYKYYKDAIHYVGKNNKIDNIYKSPGISIKLSALHPRYCRSQYKRVINELYPRLLSLVFLAKKYNIGINIDAEESERIEISINLLSKLCFEPKLSNWNGIGFVVQSYQKCCLKVIDELVDIAKNSNHRLMIRLVKGAYWDYEIKRAQEKGLENYTVFTRKVYTDLSYISCAQKLLSFPYNIYPQFATHNVHTISSIYHFAGNHYYFGQYEFQCLFGMGEFIYEEIIKEYKNTKYFRPCRIYAPVGNYNTLLSYLSRRLLENGANNSFINQIFNPSVSLEEIISDPIDKIIKISKKEGCIGLPNPKIPSPRNIYSESRINSIGLDLSNEYHLYSLSKTFSKENNKKWNAEPIFLGKSSNGHMKNIYSPYDYRNVIGNCRISTYEDISQAISSSVNSFSLWSNIHPNKRASILKESADKLEKEIGSFINLLVKESGKSITNSMSEVRESVDFLRYYAYQIENNFSNDYYKPIGPILCISPWNFPLAIFTGQISAALAAGNTVIAKPADQTPIIASKIVKLMISSGIPDGVLQMLPGKGEIIGDFLVKDPRICGVMFTGSNKVAKILQISLCKRLGRNNKPIPFIAETGGINSMIVDSTSLIEQVINDVIRSAFDSAGQRCSSLRILCIQEDISEKILYSLREAMSEYTIGNPEYLSTDIGPVINNESKSSINGYISYMRKKGYTVWQTNCPERSLDMYGYFVPLTLIEVNDVTDVKKEVFGPVLHIVRYKKDQIKSLINKINSIGYGLTFGIHSRINNIIDYTTEKINVGNYYVNRNIIGAVVGVQPFGGENLSGTGPKAGGPLYLYKLLSKMRSNEVLPSLLALDRIRKPDFSLKEVLQKNYYILLKWIELHFPNISPHCQNFGKLSQAGSLRILTGPTGEENIYKLLPHVRILCLSDRVTDLLVQLSASMSVGSEVIWEGSSENLKLFNVLPKPIQKKITITEDWENKDTNFSSVLFHGNSDDLLELMGKISNVFTNIRTVHGYEYGDYNILLEELLVERVISTNTTAFGGNIKLITSC